VVGDLLQVLRGQVQIAGRHLQILMAEQKLNGAQVGTGFEQMRGPCVSNQVRRNGLAKQTTSTFCEPKRVDEKLPSLDLGPCM